MAPKRIRGASAATDGPEEAVAVESAASVPHQIPAHNNNSPARPQMRASGEKAALASIKVGERIRKDPGDIESLAQSMSDFGLLTPVQIKPDGTLLCGERRLKAAKLLGWTTIPVTIIEKVDP
jgi:ParB-like nuclease domain